MAAFTIWFRLLEHDDFLAASRAFANTGNKIAAKIAMIAMTTRSSMSVNAFLLNNGLLTERVLPVQMRMLALVKLPPRRRNETPIY